MSYQKTPRGKIKVRLALEYDMIITVWMSRKQFNNLCAQLEWDSGSSRRAIVWCVLEHRDDGCYRYIWASRGEYEWMCAAFNADTDSAPDPENTIFWSEIPTLKVPESVEVADELLDAFVGVPETSSE
jgi:hypothetical protein